MSAAAHRMDATSPMGPPVGVGGWRPIRCAGRNGRNQGGIRTAALLGFDVPKEEFVATATAIGLFVDGARQLGHLQQTTFRKIIGALLILLGLYMAVAGRG